MTYLEFDGDLFRRPDPGNPDLSDFYLIGVGWCPYDDELPPGREISEAECLTILRRTCPRYLPGDPQHLNPAHYCQGKIPDVGNGYEYDGEPRRSNTRWMPRLEKIREIQAKVRRLHLDDRQTTD
jgi:hypothetical protein